MDVKQYISERISMQNRTGSSSRLVRAPVAKWVKRWPNKLAALVRIPLQAEIYSTNGVQLHIAISFSPSHRSDIIEILL